MVEDYRSNQPKAGLALLAFPLFLSLLAIIQPINITHIDGLPDDFSGMIIEAVTWNSTYDVPYETIEKQDGEWILVNATLPEENYTLNVLSTPSASAHCTLHSIHSSAPLHTNLYTPALATPCTPASTVYSTRCVLPSLARISYTYTARRVPARDEGYREMKNILQMSCGEPSDHPFSRHTLEARSTDADATGLRSAWSARRHRPHPPPCPY